MAYEVCRRGGTMPAVFNASNEVAVAQFLEGKLPFPGIFDLVSRALDAHNAQPVTSLEQVLEVDLQVRRTLND
jgi:1-deoxy-D-xylulose-5-phosphate reductoisomerase